MIVIPLNNEPAKLEEQTHHPCSEEYYEDLCRIVGGDIDSIPCDMFNVVCQKYDCTSTPPLRRNTLAEASLYGLGLGLGTIKSGFRGGELWGVVVLCSRYMT